MLISLSILAKWCLISILNLLFINYLLNKIWNFLFVNKKSINIYFFLNNFWTFLSLIISGKEEALILLQRCMEIVNMKRSLWTSRSHRRFLLFFWKWHTVHLYICLFGHLNSLPLDTFSISQRHCRSAANHKLACLDTYPSTPINFEFEWRLKEVTSRRKGKLCSWTLFENFYMCRVHVGNM